MSGTASRERGEGEARFLARELPDSARVIALLHEPEQAERAATVADAIATALARRREHTLLAGAAPGPSPLDAMLGGGHGAGLPGALRGRARLTDIAVQRVDRPFVYLPEGRETGAMAALLGTGEFASFVERVRERGGTLLVLAPVDALEREAARALFDGVVALGDVGPEPIPGPTGLGRVRFDDPLDDEPAAGAARADLGAGAAREGSPDGEKARPSEVPHEVETEVETEAEPAGKAGAGPGVGVPRGAWGRHRAPPSFPVRRVAAALFVVVGLGAGWWLLARAIAGPTDADAGAEMGAPGSAPGTEAEAPAPFDRAAALEALEAAPELSYSVLIASYAARSDADERLARLGRGGADGLYFLAPTPVRGAVYHRVFASARATREAAAARMTELVESGRKDEASAWDVRPVRLAFRLGLFGSRREAEERAAEAGVPAYVLAVAGPTRGPRSGPDSLFAVWAGAYESEAAATKMQEMLSAAGTSAELAPRHGAEAR